MATMPKPVAMPKPQKPLPTPNSDFYELVATLPAEELAVVKQVRSFMETKVAPIITKYWVEDAFPFELLPGIKELNIGGVGMQGYGCRGGSAQLFGLVAMEMARVDSSIATFFGVHSGLAMGRNLEPFVQGLDPRSRPFRTNSLPLVRWSSANLFLNRIQSRDSFQRLTRNGRCMRLLQVVELAPDMRPARNFRTLPFASSIWMALAAFGTIAVLSPRPAATIAVVSALSETFTGKNLAGGCTFPPSNPPDTVGANGTLGSH
jgi:hypothetical protein